MTEECQKAYQEIESALGDEGFLKTMSCLEFSVSFIAKFGIKN